MREFTGGLPTPEYNRQYRRSHLEPIRTDKRRYARSSKGRARAKAWRLANHERVREGNRLLQQEYRRRFKQYWGVSSKEIGAKGETYALILLERLGYQVMHIGRHWPFDIMARMNGIEYAFEVTTEYKKSLNAGKSHSNKRRLLNWFHWQYGVIFVKPDFTAYRLVIPDKAVQTMRVWKDHSPWRPEEYLTSIPFRI